MDLQPSTARRFQAATDVVIERMGETMLAVHLGTDKIIELNETAAHLVDLLLGGSTDREAAAAMAEVYDVPYPVVWENVESALATLVEESVLAELSD